MKKPNIYQHLSTLGLIYIIGIMLLILIHFIFNGFIAELDTKINNERVRIEIGKLIIENTNRIEGNFYRLLSSRNISNQNIIRQEISPYFKTIDNALLVLKNGGTLLVTTPLNLENISGITKEITFKAEENTYALEMIDLKPKLDNLEKQMDQLLKLVNKREHFFLNKDIPKFASIKDSLYAFGKLINSNFVRFRENANRAFYNGTINLEKLKAKIEKNKDNYNTIELIIMLLILVLMSIFTFIIARQINRTNKNLITSQLEMKIAKEEIEETNIELNKEIIEHRITGKNLRKFKLGIEQNPASIVITNIEGEIEYVNPKFCEITGYTFEEAVGNNPRILKSDEKPEEEYKELWVIITSGKTWQGEFHNKKKDGSLYWESASISPIFNEKGIISHFVAVKEDITEKRIQEGRLRKSEYILNETQSISKVGGWEYKVSEDRMIWTDEVFKIHGITNGQIPEREKSIQYYHKDYQHIITESFEKCMNEGISYDLEVKFINNQNKELWVRTSGKAISENDKVYKVVGNIADITETKRLNDQLLEKEKMFQLITENAFDFIWTIDMNMNITYSSSSVTRLLGYTEEEISKINVTSLYSEEEFQKVQKIFREELAKGAPHSGTEFNIKHLRKNGDEFNAEVKVTIIYDQNNGPVFIQGYTRDISEQLEAEEAIKSERRLLRTIIDNLPDAIYAMDIECRKTVLNRADLLNMGCISEDEAIGKTDFDFFPRDEAEKLYANDQKVIQTGQPVLEVEESFTDKEGGRHWLLTSKVPLLDSEGKITGLVGIGHDITEKKEMLEELIMSKEKAENANKMKSIFLAQMSHEIRTPINALVSMASLLRYDFEEGADEDQLMSFEIIDRAGGRIIRTIDLLLNLSEIQAGTYEIITTQFDVLSDVIAVVVAEYRKTAAKKNIIIKIDSNMVDNELVADSYTVNQIFTQLIDNAIKYAEEGEVTIKTLRNELDQLVVEIKDTGVGIAEEYLPNLFKPFSQEEMGYTRKFEGNGIGMALVSKYCELNNAKIEVESKKGVGSLFRVVFS